MTTLCYNKTSVLEQPELDIEEWSHDRTDRLYDGARRTQVRQTAAPLQPDPGRFVPDADVVRK